jgi:hypothetical protein
VRETWTVGEGYSLRRRYRRVRCLEDDAGDRLGVARVVEWPSGPLEAAKFAAEAMGGLTMLAGVRDGGPGVGDLD